MNSETTSQKTMTTTVVVHTDLHKMLKKNLIDKGITFSEWVRRKMEEDISMGNIKPFKQRDLQ